MKKWLGGEEKRSFLNTNATQNTGYLPYNQLGGNWLDTGIPTLIHSIIGIIAGSIQTAPVNVRLTAEQRIPNVVDVPRELRAMKKLLNTRLNSYISGGQFLYMTVCDLIYRGNSFWFVERLVSSGTPKALHYIGAQVNVQLRQSDENNPFVLFPVYQIAGNTLTSMDILHIKLPGIKPEVGTSPMEAILPDIQMQAALDNTTLTRAKLPAYVGVVSAAAANPMNIGDNAQPENKDNSATLSEADRFRAELNARGLVNGRGKTQFTAIKLDEFPTAQHEYLFHRITRHFKVPPSFVQDYSKINYNNHAQQTALKLNMLAPYVEAISDALNNTLLLEHYKLLGWEFFIDLTNPRNIPLTEKLALITTLTNSGAAKVNEVRNLVGMPALTEEEGGEKLIKPANMQGREFGSPPQEGVAPATGEVAPATGG